MASTASTQLPESSSQLESLDSEALRALEVESSGGEGHVAARADQEELRREESGGEQGVGGLGINRKEMKRG